MEKQLLSAAEIKRLERFAEIKRQFNIFKGKGKKTEVIKYLAQSYKCSSATVYKALRS